jgi:uncharacterized protein with NRDE domain
MCLIFFSLNNHPTYRLIIAANRDEFYNRKTAAASFWQDHPTILGGRDLEAHGSWMSMTTDGKIAMVTNYRDPANINPGAPSRGKLITDYVSGSKTGLDYLNELVPTANLYNGFNLVVGSVDKLWYLSNYKAGIDLLTKGFFGLSNHLLQTPWPKVEVGKKMLTPLLQQAHINAQQLLSVMYNDVQASDETLPQTGLPLARERALSSMFIKTDNYGTRCSTVVLVDYDNQVEFVERVYDVPSFSFHDHIFTFKITR